MNSNVKAAWLKALRGGTYIQGQDRLTTVVGKEKKTHCCLGVLCDLAIKAGVTVSVDKGAYSVRYDGESSILPASVLRWAELDEPNPDIVWNVRTQREGERSGFSLAELNDGAPAHNVRPHTFNEIADLIEREL